MCNFWHFYCFQCLLQTLKVRNKKKYKNNMNYFLCLLTFFNVTKLHDIEQPRNIPRSSCEDAKKNKSGTAYHSLPFI